LHSAHRSTLASGVVYGGSRPPIPKRADCIIPSETGQANGFSLRV